MRQWELPHENIIMHESEDLDSGGCYYVLFTGLRVWWCEHEAAPKLASA